MKKQIFLKWFILSLAIAINLFILIQAFINGEASAKESNSIAKTTADVVNTIKPETITEQNFDVFAYSLRKLIGHFGCFVLSGVFSTWSFVLFLKDKKVGYIFYQLLFIFSFGILIAFLSEFIQLFISGRTFKFGDVGIDLAGYFIGDFLVILVLFLKKHKIFSKQNYMKKQVD